MQASATNREQRQAVIVDQALTHSTFEVAFAGEVPAAWARRECEGEELCLSEIALALVPLWPAIQAAWNRSPQQVRIFTERLLQIYLRFWPASSRRQRRSPHQNAVTLLRAIRRAAQRADGPLTAIELRALFRRVIALPRAVPICFSTDRTPDLDDSALVPLPERRLRVLFREFYFPGLTPDELRTGLALASKLRFHALKQEVPLLPSTFYSTPPPAKPALASSRTGKKCFPLTASIVTRMRCSPITIGSKLRQTWTPS
jgi:hypothetical protein